MTITIRNNVDQDVEPDLGPPTFGGYAVGDWVNLGERGGAYRILRFDRWPADDSRWPEAQLFGGRNGRRAYRAAFVYRLGRRLKTAPAWAK